MTRALAPTEFIDALFPRALRPLFLARSHASCTFPNYRPEGYLRRVHGAIVSTAGAGPRSHESPIQQLALRQGLTAASP